MTLILSECLIKASSHVNPPSLGPPRSFSLRLQLTDEVLLAETFGSDVLFSLEVFRALISSKRRHIHLNPSRAHHPPGTGPSEALISSASVSSAAHMKCSAGKGESEWT